jgi:CheY-like chemotaxis protein
VTSKDRDFLKSLLKSKNLLIVEDSEINRIILHRSFNQYFNEILIAQNGQEAIKIFKEKSIDLIISDISMPFVDGITLSNEIRNINSSIPIILLTSIEDKEKIEEAEVLNIEAFYQKPFDFNTISKVIIDIFNK